ncbi:MAG: glycosyltransferase [Oscillospiraceae bacterium]|nr:glycosyltransferase [Oscillospiraceae bacterium]
MSKLSIIVPIYNVEKYLAACLDSLLYPELDGYEIIAVNDGSTDASGEIAGQYAARYPSLIRTVTTPNGGLGQARNVGLELASGEYVMFVDSDDTLRDRAVTEILSLLDGSFDILIFDFLTVNEDGKVFAHERCCGREGDFSFAEYPELLFDAPNACNKVWRRSLFSENGIRFPAGLWFEDLATSPRLYLHAERFRYVPEAWYRYLQRGGSITNSRSPERNREMITVIDMVTDYYREAGQFERYRPQLAYMACRHELLFSTTRVNLAAPDSPVQDLLLADFLARFPDFRENPYMRQMPKQHRLLVELIVRRRRRAVHALMKLNNILKGKNT